MYKQAQPSCASFPNLLDTGVRSDARVVWEGMHGSSASAKIVWQWSDGATKNIRGWRITVGSAATDTKYVHSGFRQDPTRFVDLTSGWSKVDGSFALSTVGVPTVTCVGGTGYRVSKGGNARRSLLTGGVGAVDLTSPGWAPLTNGLTLTIALSGPKKVLGFISGQQQQLKYLKLVKIGYSGKSSFDASNNMVDEGVDFVMEASQKRHFFKFALPNTRYVKFFAMECANRKWDLDCKFTVALITSVSSVPKINEKAAWGAPSQYRYIANDSIFAANNGLTKIREYCRRWGGAPATAHDDIEWDAIRMELQQHTGSTDAYLLLHDTSGSFLWDDGTDVHGVLQHFHAYPPSADSICYIEKAISTIKCNPLASMDVAKGFLCKFRVDATAFNAVGIVANDFDGSPEYHAQPDPKSNTQPMGGPSVLAATPTWLGISRSGWESVYGTYANDGHNALFDKIYPRHVQALAYTFFPDSSKFVAPTLGIYLLSMVYHAGPQAGDISKIGLFRNGVTDFAYVVSQARPSATDYFPHSAMAIMQLNASDTVEMRPIFPISVTRHRNNFFSGARIHTDVAFHATWSDHGYPFDDTTIYPYVLGQIVPFPHVLANVGAAFKHHGVCPCNTERCNCDRFRQKSTFTAPEEGAYFFAFSVSIWKAAECPGGDLSKCTGSHLTTTGAASEKQFAPLSDNGSEKKHDSETRLFLNDVALEIACSTASAQQSCVGSGIVRAKAGDVFDVRAMVPDSETWLGRRYPMADYWLGFKIPSMWPDDGTGRLTEYYEELPGLPWEWTQECPSIETNADYSDNTHPKYGSELGGPLENPAGLTLGVGFAYEKLGMLTFEECALWCAKQRECTGFSSESMLDTEQRGKCYPKQKLKSDSSMVKETGASPTRNFLEMTEACREAVEHGGVPVNWGSEVDCLGPDEVVALRSANPAKGVFWHRGRRKCRLIPANLATSVRTRWKRQGYFWNYYCGGELSDGGGGIPEAGCSTFIPRAVSNVPAVYAVSGTNKINYDSDDTAKAVTFENVAFLSGGDATQYDGTGTFAPQRAGTYYCGISAMLASSGTASGMLVHRIKKGASAPPSGFPDPPDTGEVDTTNLIHVMRGTQTTGGNLKAEGVAGFVVVNLMPGEKVQASNTAQVKYQQHSSRTFMRGVTGFWCFMVNPQRAFFEWTQAPVPDRYPEVPFGGRGPVSFYMSPTTPSSLEPSEIHPYIGKTEVTGGGATSQADLLSLNSCGTFSSVDGKVRDRPCNYAAKGFLCSKAYRTEAGCYGCMNPVSKTMMQLVDGEKPNCPIQAMHFAYPTGGSDDEAVSAASADACAAACNLKPDECKGYTFDPAPVCTLKKGSMLLGLHPKDGHTAGICSPGMKCNPLKCKQIRHSCKANEAQPALDAGTTEADCEEMPYHIYKAWELPAVAGCCFTQPRMQGSTTRMQCDTGFRLWEKFVGGGCQGIANGNTHSTVVPDMANQAIKVDNVERCAKACGSVPTCGHFLFYHSASGYTGLAFGPDVTDKNCFLRVEQFKSVSAKAEMADDLQKGPPCAQIPVVWKLTIRQDLC